MGADISKCCGAIDGMLVWLQKPNNAVVEKAGCNSQKFYCGRKKFGINLQATFDHRRRFMNISMKVPGATSDFFAFDTSKFWDKICTPGFLSPGL